MSFFDFFRSGRKKEEQKPEKVDWEVVPYSTHRLFRDTSADIANIVFPNLSGVEAMHQEALPVLANDASPELAMDSSPLDIKGVFSVQNSRVSDLLMGWYARQGFIGYQSCAIIAQHWLVNKACEAPPKDAFRNGWKISADGVDSKILKDLQEKDEEYKVGDGLLQYAKMNRVFGIRIAIFKVDSPDSKYYENPFNIDGVGRGTYRGIAQVDPYWCIPELLAEDVRDPSSINFYEPEFWIIGGRRYHRSHLKIQRYAEVADILKPSYLYGGMSLSQMIYERVYCAERSANEMPQLLMTKRMNVEKVDLKRIITDPVGFRNRVEDGIFLRDNYGTKFIGKDEDYTQHETSLADADIVVMTEFQLAASVANMPATRLIEMQPNGFNTAGDNEQKNYRQYLKTIQKHEGSEFLERHYTLLLKSEHGITAKVKVDWNPTDDPTSQELADINVKKSNYYNNLQQTGAISAEEIAKALNNDDNSGFIDLAPDSELDLMRLLTGASDSEWNENDHPRDKDGKFGSGGGSESSEQQDISGLIGTEYTGVKGTNAINKLLEEKQGHVKGAFTREDIGDIDLIWGNDDIGLRHIIKRRKEQGIDTDKLLSELPEVIEKGKLRVNNEGNFEIWHNGNMAVVYPEFKNNKITFLVTAYRQRKAPKDLRA